MVLFRLSFNEANLVSVILKFVSYQTQIVLFVNFELKIVLFYLDWVCLV